MPIEPAENLRQLTEMTKLLAAAAQELADILEGEHLDRIRYATNLIASAADDIIKASKTIDGR